MLYNSNDKKMSKLKQNMNKHSVRGFTLLEILLVVAAISILAGIVIVAINPVKQLADIRNAQRKVDVNTILNAIKQYQIDNKGALPGLSSSPNITPETTEMCKTGTTSCSGLINTSDLTTSSKYLVAMPVDPSTDSINGTGYFVRADANSRITVSAPGAENDVTVSVTN